MDSATERLLEYAGKRRNQVSNPRLTANQAIAVANDIQSLQRERDALRGLLLDSCCHSHGEGWSEHCAWCVDTLKMLVGNVSGDKE